MGPAAVRLVAVVPEAQAETTRVAQLLFLAETAEMAVLVLTAELEATEAWEAQAGRPEPEEAVEMAVILDSFP